MSVLQMVFLGGRGERLAAYALATREQVTYAVPPGTAQVVLTFPEQPLMPPPPSREDSPEFRAHVLRWLQTEQGIPDAAEVLSVSGYGSDYAEGDTENGFYPDEDIEVKWRDGAGKEHYRELRGDDFMSLWSWVVGSWPAPEAATS